MKSILFTIDATPLQIAAVRRVLMNTGAAGIRVHGGGGGAPFFFFFFFTWFSLVFALYRADSTRASTDGGAGLGLAIAQWIVDLHGGEIHPERRDPHGCRMVVDAPHPSLPLTHRPNPRRHRCRSPPSTKP